MPGIAKDAQVIINELQERLDVAYTRHQAELIEERERLQVRWILCIIGRRSMTLGDETEGGGGSTSILCYWQRGWRDGEGRGRHTSCLAG